MNWNGRMDELKDEVIARLRHELPINFFYHSPEHTLDVIQSSEQIAIKEGCSPEDIYLIKTAALFHDTGYILDMREHEKKSCTLASEMLAKIEVEGHMIEKICEIIMATKMPQAPQDRLGEILCDADLDYLGRDDYFSIAETLYKEFKANGKVQNEEEWKQVQINFLQAHRYFTKTSIQLRQPKKEKNLLKIKSGMVNS
jgi:uncharacterized protein